MDRARLGSSVLLSFGEFFRRYWRERGIGFVRDEETMVRFGQIMSRISERFFGKSIEPG